MKTPYPFQAAAIAKAIKRDSLVLLDRGLGKTLVGTEVIRHYHERGPGMHLVVAPKRALIQWRATLAEQMPGCDIHVSDKDNRSPLASTSKRSVVLTHFENVYRSEWIAAMPWTALVVDEAHRIKNSTTLRSKGVRKLNAVRKVAMTGSAIERTPLDLWCMLKWLSPGERYFSAKNRFEAMFVHFDTNYLGYKTPTGGKNLDILATLMEPFTSQATKASVAPQLPPLILTDEIVRMLPEQDAMYNAISRAKDIDIDAGDVNLIVLNTLAKMTKLQQVSSDPHLLGSMIESAKMKWIADFMEDLDEQTVFFTRFRSTALQLSQRYSGSLVIGGRDCDADITAFKEGHRQTMFGTIGAMGEALDLPMAKTAVFIDTTWSATEMAQARDRIHRITNTEPRNVITLVSSPIDELINTAVKEKWSTSALVQKALSQQLLR